MQPLGVQAEEGSVQINHTIGTGSQILNGMPLAIVGHYRQRILRAQSVGECQPTLRLINALARIEAQRIIARAARITL